MSGTDSEGPVPANVETDASASAERRRGGVAGRDAGGAGVMLQLEEAGRVVSADAVVFVPLLNEKRGSGRSAAGAVRTPDARMAEITGLAAAVDLAVHHAAVVGVPRPRPATLFGPGKVDELAAIVAALEAEVVVIDHPLTPVQQRNLERALKAKVLDRTGLILEIFGARAQTREGRLQVELAHLDYQRSRLVRSWTHLERQRGGAGFMGGPGERQIESDRRMLREKIDGIRRDLDVVTRTRDLHRKGRARKPYPIIALVGYTNAGKSTLFNALAQADVLVKDQLFATLDPTMRRVTLAGGREVIFSDTVGFISELPTTLIAAFRATLEEVLEADVILHVRDIAEPDTEAQRRDVLVVLGELGVDPDAPERTVVEVWNKVDLLDAAAREVVDNRAKRCDPPAMPVSAVTGVGLGELLVCIDGLLAKSESVLQLDIGWEHGALLNWIHENADVLKREDTDAGSTRLTVRLNDANRRRLEARIKAPSVIL